MAADLKIGGFNGAWGEGVAIDRKIKLLRDEGVQFDTAKQRILKDCVFTFDEGELVQKAIEKPPSSSKRRRDPSDVESSRRSKYF